MTILSRLDLIRRILAGERIICQESVNAKRKKDLDIIEECLRYAEKCLKTIGSKGGKNNMGKREEDPFKSLEECLKKYFKKERFSRGHVEERRQTIKKFASAHKSFLGKNFSEVESLKAWERPIFIDDIDYENCLRGANYDLRLGEDVYVTTERVPRKLTRPNANDSIAIEPGEFGVLMTHEYIYVPHDLMGFISVRLTYKQKGVVNISGFHVDPGFYGRLMFAVYNAGPSDVVLRYKKPVFMIMFNKLTNPVPKIIESKWHGMKDIPIEALAGLRGTSVSVRNLHERMNRLEMLFPVVITGIVGLVVAVLAWILTHW